MNAGKMALSVLAGIFALAAARGDGALTDDEVKERIVKFVTLPGMLCGRATVDFRKELRTRKLTNRPWFDGDTNRLARLICELAQTNDVKVAGMMVRTLGEYGTPAQLPFLYTCATNPVYGNRAVKAVLRIEGVTSNSVEMLHSYLTFTNSITRQQAYNRAVVCTDFLDCLRDSCAVLSLKEWTYQVVRSFAADINTSNSIVDQALIVSDDTYRYSKRRLAVMRAAYPRCFNEYQTNYVTNAINELVAYPEANLPE